MVWSSTATTMVRPGKEKCSTTTPTSTTTTTPKLASGSSTRVGSLPNGAPTTACALPTNGTVRLAHLLTKTVPTIPASAALPSGAKTCLSAALLKTTTALATTRTTRCLPLRDSPSSSTPPISGKTSMLHGGPGAMPTTKCGRNTLAISPLWMPRAIGKTPIPQKSSTCPSPLLS